MVYGKVPPQAKELEEAVLGALLLVPSCFEEVSEILRPECFYVDAHQRVYRAICEINQRGQMVDMLLVIEQLKKTEELDIVGGPYFVMKLTSAVVSSANVVAHAAIVFQKFVQREVIRISGELIGEAYEDSTDVFDLMDEAEQKLSSIIHRSITTSYKSASELAKVTVERVDYLRTNKGAITGVSSGYTPIDKATNGWQPTDLIIIAARPSVGKTAFALNLARNAIINSFKPTPVGFFSLEMSATQLMQRVISADGQISLEKITTGQLNDQKEYEQFVETSVRVGSMPLYIDDTPALNVLEFRSRARRMVHKNKVGLIIVDYLQLMSGLRERNSNREQEISTISRNLKALAKELHIPIIALSQLTRAVDKEKRPPELSDLRESGAIEQDADLVMFLTRPTYQQEEKNVDPAIRNDADVWIKKNRQGKLDKMPFKTVLSIQRWFDLNQFDDYQRKRQGLIPMQEAEKKFFIEQGAVLNTDDDLSEELPF